MIPSLSFVALSLFFVNVLAAPLPMPGLNQTPKPGDVVMAHPGMTDGHANTGATTVFKLHPHVVTNSDPNSQVVQLSQITNKPTENFKPHIPLPASAAPLTGHARLQPVTAHINDLREHDKQLKGHNVGDETLNKIRTGQAQVAASHDAAVAHEMAHHAHAEAHASHSAAQAAHASIAHVHPAHGDAANAHGHQASFHASQANLHLQTAQQYHHDHKNPGQISAQAVKEINDNKDRAHKATTSAQESHNHAVAAHTHLVAANAHEQAKGAHAAAGQAHHANGNYNQAAQHVEPFGQHGQTAHNERAQALAHHPAAAHPPHAGASINQANKSIAHAQGSIAHAAQSHQHAVHSAQGAKHK